jgi:hypothetical protein
LKKLNGEPLPGEPSPSQSVLGATWPVLGSSTITESPVPPTETPPVVVVTWVAKGNISTPETPGGGAGKVGVSNST